MAQPALRPGIDQGAVEAAVARCPGVVDDDVPVLGPGDLHRELAAVLRAHLDLAPLHGAAHYCRQIAQAKITAVPEPPGGLV